MVAELRRELELHLAESRAIGDIVQESRENVTDARTEVAADNGATAELLQQIEVLTQELQDARAKERNHDIAIADLETKIDGKDDEIRRLKYQLRVIPDYEPPHPEEPELPLHFDKVEDAVVSAEQDFDRLKFLDSAFKSVDDYPFQRPQEVYDALSLLNEVAALRLNGPVGKSIEDWMQEHGCDYAPRESEATMNQYRDTRQFGGYEMQEHIKIGGHNRNQQHYIRIHFCWESESAQYIIGHVGEHLPTVSG